jgi:hypothetical protein
VNWVARELPEEGLLNRRIGSRGLEADDTKGMLDQGLKTINDIVYVLIDTRIDGLIMSR